MTKPVLSKAELRAQLEAKLSGAGDALPAGAASGA
jgi:hypothetical protein